MPTFAERCAEAEAVACEIEKLAKQLQQAAAAMKRAAREGNPGKIRQAAAQIDDAGARTAQIQNTLGRAWPLNDGELTELLKGPYVEQLIETAAAAGVTISRLDNCLAAFPVILQVFPDSKTIKLDNTRIAALHPKLVIEKLRSALKKTRSNPEKFIEVLYKTYRLIVRDQHEQGTTLTAIYDALTLLPEARKTYGKAEFTRDVYELDVSGVKSTAAGAALTLSASTGTRSKSETLSIISPNGMPRYYYGIRFERAS